MCPCPLTRLGCPLRPHFVCAMRACVCVFRVCVCACLCACTSCVPVCVRLFSQVTDPRTAVVSFPVDSGEGVRTVGEVSMWEQLGLAALLQRHWADNQVRSHCAFSLGGGVDSLVGGSPSYAARSAAAAAD